MNGKVGVYSYGIPKFFTSSEDGIHWLFNHMQGIYYSLPPLLLAYSITCVFYVCTYHHFLTDVPSTGTHVPILIHSICNLAGVLIK